SPRRSLAGSHVQQSRPGSGTFRTLQALGRGLRGRHAPPPARPRRELWRGGPRDVAVRYGGGPNEHLDIFPTSKADAPVLVFIHGGYWRSLDKRDHSFVAPALTREGVCAVIPNYALCPAVTIPQITMQLVQALAWTWRHIARRGGDPNR